VGGGEEKDHSRKKLHVHQNNEEESNLMLCAKKGYGRTLRSQGHTHARIFIKGENHNITVTVHRRNEKEGDFINQSNLIQKSIENHQTKNPSNSMHRKERRKIKQRVTNTLRIKSNT